MIGSSFHMHAPPLEDITPNQCAEWIVAETEVGCIRMICIMAYIKVGVGFHSDEKTRCVPLPVTATGNWAVIVSILFARSPAVARFDVSSEMSPPASMESGALAEETAPPPPARVVTSCMRPSLRTWRRVKFPSINPFELIYCSHRNSHVCCAQIL